MRDADKEKIVEPLRKFAGARIQDPGDRRDPALPHRPRAGKAEKVNKVSEGRPHAADAVRNGAVQLMFNTTEGATSLANSKPLRRAALLQKTPYYTTISGAIAAGSRRG